MDSSLRLTTTLDRLRESLWLLPAVALALAIAAAELIPLVDAALPRPFWFSSNADSARSLLSSIATATLTLTGLVFSITMLVLQLTSSQLSPRVMRRFLRDRTNQAVLALFIATFAYELLAIRNVEADDVPAFSVWGGFLLAMASVGAFIYYINHMAQSIRAANVIAGIGADTRDAIDRVYGDPVDEGGEVDGQAVLPMGEPDLTVSREGHGGVLTNVGLDRVAEIARQREALIALRPGVGDFVPQGAPLFDVWGHLSDEQARELQEAVAVGRERTMQQDAAFGLRQLVDIAERALSPGVNDPTTAVQAIDQLHDLLRRLATRRLAADVRRAADGSVAVVMPRPDWEAFVGLTVDEIRIAGASSMQTHRRLRHLLVDVMTAAPPHRRNALRNQLRLLDEVLEEGFSLEADRRLAAEASPRGHSA